jgi:IS5 family transposase
MVGKQLCFSDCELTTAKKQIKRDKFLSEMEVVVPLQALIDVIEPHYPKASKKGGRPSYPLAQRTTCHPRYGQRNRVQLLHLPCRLSGLRGAS